MTAELSSPWLRSTDPEEEHMLKQAKGYAPSARKT